MDDYLDDLLDPGLGATELLADEPDDDGIDMWPGPDGTPPGTRPPSPEYLLPQRPEQAAIPAGRGRCGPVAGAYHGAFQPRRSVGMDEDRFNTEIRSFLKKVGITSQREIEKAARERVEDGTLKGNEALSASVVLKVPELDIELTIADDIRLE